MGARREYEIKIHKVFKTNPQNKSGMMSEKTVIMAGDHNGVELKRHLYNYLRNKGYACIDLGPYTDTIKVDYTDYATQLANIIHNGDISRGLLICGTGVGMSIAANRFPNVRAALIHNLESAPKSREHNDANVLCLGAWITAPRIAEEILDAWLNTSFGEGRHVKRVEKISSHKPNTVVFTNGIFDVIHKGHTELLKFAKSLGDKLIVAINSDRSTKLLKGPDRPINNENDRKKILESMKEVDQVIIFDDVKTKPLIEEVQPNVVVKGGEWTAEEVRRRDEIPQHIDVKVFPIIKDYSTKGILDRIIEQNTKQKNNLDKKKKVVFTNGVFDIIHEGHIELFKFAKSLGEKLIVAINSDKAVKELKGPTRPINNEQNRKKALEAIKYVDEVVIFDDVDPAQIRDNIRPDILVKGGEWTSEEVRRRDKVLPETEVVIFPFVKGYSTTSTLEKIQMLKTWEKKPDTRF